MTIKSSSQMKDGKLEVTIRETKSVVNIVIDGKIAHAFDCHGMTAEEVVHSFATLLKKNGMPTCKTYSISITNTTYINGKAQS